MGINSRETTFEKRANMPVALFYAVANSFPPVGEHESDITMYKKIIPDGYVFSHIKISGAENKSNIGDNLLAEVRRMIDEYGICFAIEIQIYNDHFAKHHSKSAARPDICISSNPVFSHTEYPPAPWTTRCDEENTRKTSEEKRDIVGITIEHFAACGYSISIDTPFPGVAIPACLANVDSEDYQEAIDLVSKKRLGKNQKARLSKIRDQSGICTIALRIHERCCTNEQDIDKLKRSIGRYVTLIELLNSQRIL